MGAMDVRGEDTITGEVLLESRNREIGQKDESR